MLCFQMDVQERFVLECEFAVLAAVDFPRLGVDVDDVLFKQRSLVEGFLTKVAFEVSRILVSIPKVLK